MIQRKEEEEVGVLTTVLCFRGWSPIQFLTLRIRE